MPYPLLIILLMLFFACNSPKETVNANPGTLDSILVAQYNVAHLEPIEVCMLDTNSHYNLQSAYRIENDTIYLFQYAELTFWGWEDEAMSYNLAMKIPLSDLSSYFDVGPDSGQVHCERMNSFYISYPSQLKEYSGYVQIIQRQDSSLIFRQDITLLVYQSDTEHPARYHYDGMETAIYEPQCDIIRPNYLGLFRRRVIR